MQESITLCSLLMAEFGEYMQENITLCSLLMAGFGEYTQENITLCSLLMAEFGEYTQENITLCSWLSLMSTCRWWRVCWCAMYWNTMWMVAWGWGGGGPWKLPSFIYQLPQQIVLGLFLFFVLHHSMFHWFGLDLLFSLGGGVVWLLIVRVITNIKGMQSETI